MEEFLKDLNAMYPTITKLYSIGNSVEGRKLYVLEVTKDPGVHIPGEFEKIKKIKIKWSFESDFCTIKHLFQ